MREALTAALARLASGPLRERATALFGALGYKSERKMETGGAAGFAEWLEDRKPLTRPQRALFDDWRDAEIVFQIVDDEIADSQGELLRDAGFDESRIRSFLFAAVDLEDKPWTRTRLAETVRAVNARTAMPVILLFRHGAAATLAVVHRRAHRRDDGRDVLEKVTLVKDVRCAGPHRAHLDILADLALPRLIDAEGVHDFDSLHAAWERALDIEALNRRFYRELFAWFERAVAEARFPDDGAGAGSGERHVIRLVTRLLFIWFLAEKGLAPHRLFTVEFAHAALKNHDSASGDYYRAVLQNLFFATLNTGIDKRAFSKESAATHRDFDRYRYRALLADPDGFVEALKTVPFVNGGLFDCLDDFAGRKEGGRRIDAFTDNAAQGAGLCVPARLFFDERGLFPLLRRYKFTVEENTPLDREVALDPELLGHVFENLLAAYNPETQETARKATGSYYTPRHVVDYMVGEALVAALAEKARPTDGDDAFWRERLRYLLDYEDAFDDAAELFDRRETEAAVRAIAGLRVLDPAAGSGAFPMGALHKLTLALRRLDPRNELWEAIQKERARARADAAFDVGDAQAREDELRDISRTFETYRGSDFGRKLYLIQNGLFGVDIQPIACQIAKLRFFVSLAIEQRTNDDPADNYGIRPLPNLETRFVAADALIGLGGEAAQGVLGSAIVAEKQERLRRVRERYFNARSRDEKKKHRDEDRRLREALAGDLEELGFPHDDAEAVAAWDPYDQNASAGWFDPAWMFGAEGGFDVVVGNPPYIRGEKIPGKARLRAAFGGFYKAMADIYTYFFRKGVDFLTNGGTLCFISSNKFMRTNYGEPLRAFLAESAPPLSILDFGRTGTFDATVRPLVLLARKGGDHDALRAATVRGASDSAAKPDEFMENSGFTLPVASLSPGGWSLADPALLRLRGKIEKAGTPLGEYATGGINYGIKTGLNAAFVIDEETRARLIAEDPNSADLIKPWLRGRDVRRWCTDRRGLSVIAIASSANVAWPWSTQIQESRAAAVFRKAYPAVYTHLSAHEERLRNRQDKGRFFWELRSCAYYDEFSRPKIIYPDIGTKMRAVLDNEGHLTGNTCYMLPGDNASLLAILNSRILDFWCRLSIPCLDNPFDGGDMRFIRTAMQHAPIMSTPRTTAKCLASLANRILAAKRANPTADTAGLEVEIDKIIYALYGIDEEEIALIEKALRP